MPESEFYRGDVPDSLHFVGVLPVQGPASWTEPAWWGELAGDRPVVVNQGILANHDLSALVEPTLADEDVLVVAALGRDAALIGPTPANARVEPCIPFDRLPSHADVFVTNGGFGATQHALAGSTPVVIASDTEDEPAVAARVALHGVGLDLKGSRPVPDGCARRLCVCWRTGRCGGGHTPSSPFTPLTRRSSLSNGPFREVGSTERVLAAGGVHLR